MQNFKKSPRVKQSMQTGPGKLGWRSRQPKSQPEIQAGRPVTTSPKVMPHRYKTQMCKNFENGNSCQFGQRCNYAHGEV